jgi:NTP pyrophosphatase (non-canonical NTP hydrolase)
VTDINQVARRANKTAADHGWWDEGQRDFPTKIALIHSELSEALEQYRKYGLSKEWLEYLDEGKPEGVGPELADVLIRTLDLMLFLGLDIDAVVEHKQTYNATRSYRHGGKVI